MLKNYFKIAIAVLKRRKFFTFISLFGISFTLTILMVLTSFLDHLLSPSYPDVNRGRELFIDRIKIDHPKEYSSRQAPPGIYFYDHYVAKLKVPVKLAIYTGTEPANAYQGHQKITVDLNYTNVAFWDVYQFKFIEGKPFNQQQLTNRDRVVVISADTRAKYFGQSVQALGKYIEANNIKYRVVGVVKPTSFLNHYCYADLYLPLTLSNVNIRERTLMSESRGFSATMLAGSEGDLDKMKTEFAQMAKKLPVKDKNEFIYIFADNFLESFTREISGGGEDSGITRVYLIAVLFVFLFMLLPTINLVNINLSRMMERSSEIGVRKAFGASNKTLAYQFVVENLILTLFGGILGVLFSWIAIHILNSSDLVPNMELQINLSVLFYSLIACLIFGLFSGVYPAWRMSKLDVVNALKAN